MKKAGVRPIRPAAVLVPVVEHAEPTVLLTQRAPDLPDHSGQVAFPGGKIDKTDASPPPPRCARPTRRSALTANSSSRSAISTLSDLLGFRILPLVARVDPDFRLKINPGEVADAFEVPLEFLMARQYQRLSRDWQGIERQYYAMPFSDRYIWGVTAGILRNLYERI